MDIWILINNQIRILMSTGTKKGGGKAPIKRNVAAQRKAEAAKKRAEEKAQKAAADNANAQEVQTEAGNKPPLPDVTLEVATLPGSERVKGILAQGRKNLKVANDNLALAQSRLKTAQAEMNTAQMAYNGERKTLISQAEMIALTSGKLDENKSYQIIPSEGNDLILCFEQKQPAK